jgi:hypothetical protein
VTIYIIKLLFLWFSRNYLIMFLLYFNPIATQWYTQTHLYLILNSIQSIKQFTDGPPIYALYELSIHLSVCALRGSTDDLLSKGCTCREEEETRWSPRCGSLPTFPWIRCGFPSLLRASFRSSRARLRPELLRAPP